MEDIEEEIFMKSPVGMKEIDPGSSSEDCYQLKKGFMDCVKQQDNFGENLWTQKNVDTVQKTMEQSHDIRIIMMYTFYQSVYHAYQN